MVKKMYKKEVLFISILVILVIISFISITANIRQDFVGKAAYNTLSVEQKQAYWDCFKINKCSELLSAKKNKEYRECSLSCNKQAETATVNVWCEDSDKGGNFFEKGIVKTNIYSNGKEDSCYTFPNGKVYLFEGQCKNNKYQYVQKNCAELGEDYICEDGRCRKKEKYIVAVREISEFLEVAKYFAEKKKVQLIIYPSLNELVPKLKDATYLALVYSPEELTPDLMHELDKKLRDVDNDPFLDVAFGIITSFTKEDAYVYVDRILSYNGPTEPTVYNPNPDYLVKKLNNYDIKTTFGCLSLFTPLSTPCSKDEEHTMEIVLNETTKNSILWFNVHGSPSSLLFSNNEKIIGSPEGAIGLLFKSLGVNVWCGDGEYIGEYEENDTNSEKVCIEKIGTIDGMKKQSTALYTKKKVSTNAALIIADSCITARINGVPTFNSQEEKEIMTTEVGIINESVPLSFLKSGGYAYFGSTVQVMSQFFATPELINLAILNGESIGIALKEFKNRNILVTMLVPEEEKYTKKIADLQTTSWFLFGDPSMKLSAKKITPNNCVKKIQKDNGKYNITVYFDQVTLNNNFEIISKILPKGGIMYDVQSLGACLIRIPKAKNSYSTNLKIPDGYIPQTMWDAGDEIFIVVPDISSGVDINFEVI